MAERTLRRAAQEKAITTVLQPDELKLRRQEGVTGINLRSFTDIGKVSSYFGTAPYVFGVEEEAGEGLWELLKVFRVGDEVAPVRVDTLAAAKRLKWQP